MKTYEVKYQGRMVRVTIPAREPEYSESFVRRDGVTMLRVKYTCMDCGRLIDAWVAENKVADGYLCMDCRDKADRAAHGWTPENSVD